MPAAPATSPTIAPARTPSPYTSPTPEPEIWPDTLCPQQRREQSSPDVCPSVIMIPWVLLSLAGTFTLTAASAVLT